MIISALPPSPAASEELYFGGNNAAGIDFDPDTPLESDQQLLIYDDGLSVDTAMDCKDLLNCRCSNLPKLKISVLEEDGPKTGSSAQGFMVGLSARESQALSEVVLKRREPRHMGMAENEGNEFCL